MKHWTRQEVGLLHMGATDYPAFYEKVAMELNALELRCANAEMLLRHHLKPVSPEDRLDPDGVP